VAGAAADARETTRAARHPTRTCELTTGTAAYARHTALTAGTAVGPPILTAGATAVGVTATAARILLENYMSGGRADRSRTRFGCRHRHYSHRCGNSPTNNKRFQHTEYGHVGIFTPSTHAQNIESQS
jgi:hypothetical protein